MIPPPGAHGGDGAAIAAALGLAPDAVLDLSASLNPFAPDVPALARRHLDALTRYPDVDRAEALLADGLDLPRERLVLTAGGAQAIALVADHVGAGRVDEPEFSLYRRHLAVVAPDAIPWRSDPHNPTGHLAPHPSPSVPVAVLRAGARRTATGTSGSDETTDQPGVWDEAFLPLSAGVWTRGRPGWALGSLTKAFACPGLRLGYLVAPDPDQAATLRRRRPAWAVDGLACALLPELLSQADPVGWTRRIGVARTALVEALVTHGLTPQDGDAPWVLVPHAAALRDQLARHAVVVRDCASFGLDGHVRIAVPDDAGLERLRSALEKVCT